MRNKVNESGTTIHEKLEPSPQPLEAPYAAPDKHYLKGWKLCLVTISLALGMFLVGIDSSIIGVAVPKITSSFHSLDDVGWYGSAYMLPHTVLQPTFGAFYKSFDITYIYLASILVFEIGSSLCAAAPSSIVFIIGRIIAGCGAAGIFQGTLCIVGCSVPKKKVPLYYGYVLSVQGISACSAPIFGGALTDAVSWRWCFWINLPIGGLVLFLAWILIRPQPADASVRSLPVLNRLQRIDWLGTALFLGAFTCLFFALHWGGQTKPWNSSEVVGLFVGFGLLLCVFVTTQRYTGDNSLLPPRILLQRTVLFGSIYLMLFGLAMAVYLYYIPIYFQAVHLKSATNSGIRLIALDVARIVFIIISGALVTKFGSYMPYMTVGTVITAVGAGLLTTWTLNTSTARSTAYMFIVGAGAGIGGNQPFAALQAVLSDVDMPIGNGITVFALQLGTSLAFAISQTVFLTKIFHRVESSSLTAAISRPAIVAAGASHLEHLAKGRDVLFALRMAYMDGIRCTMIVALSAVCLCHLCLPCMDWLKLDSEVKAHSAAMELKEMEDDPINTASHGGECEY